MTPRYRIAFNRMALTGKLPQGDRRWAEFNDGFDNLTLTPTQIADHIYRGYSFTTWHDGRRCLDNFICGQHVAIDMDTGDTRSAIDTLTAHPWVRMYASVVYTTPSHTPDAPRARVVFLLDQPVESADAYTEIALFLMAQFDNPDQACKDASRFFYGSLGCDLAMPDNVLPLAHLRRLYAVDTRRNGKRRNAPTVQPSGADVINLQVERAKRATALVENTPDELDRAVAALRKIGPYDVDYNTWIGIIHAMRDTFGAAALSAVEQWAQGQPGEVRREWERRKRGGKQMTVSTVHYIANGGRRG